MIDSKQKIIDLLQKFEITYWTSGNNVSEDSVNIKCPFCDDHSNHLGIFEDTLIFHCWRCGAKGHFAYLLSVLTHLSYEECQRLLELNVVNFKGCAVQTIENIISSEKKSDKIVAQEVGLPKYFEPVTKNMNFPLLEMYLKRRKIDLETIIKYGCGICQVGKYMNRLIIPVVFQGRIVSFQAADMTGRGEIKYKTADNEVNRWLYNYDSIKDIMIITEGILDCWRVGEGAVATFGTHITEKQKDLILAKNLKELILCWDGDAYWTARNEAEEFKPFIENVKVVCLPKTEDPDSLGTEKVWEYIVEVV